MDLLEYFTSIKHESDILHSAIPEIIPAEQNEDIVMEQALLREDFITKLYSLSNQIASQEDELAALKRGLREITRTNRVDIEKLESHKWSLIHSRKTYGK
jgi:hypothetical protein